MRWIAARCSSWTCAVSADGTNDGPRPLGASAPPFLPSSDGHEAPRTRPLERPDDVQGLFPTSRADGHVTRPPERLDLPREDGFRSRSRSPRRRTETWPRGRPQGGPAVVPVAHDSSAANAAPGWRCPVAEDEGRPPRERRVGPSAAAFERAGRGFAPLRRPGRRDPRNRRASRVPLHPRDHRRRRVSRHERDQGGRSPVRPHERRADDGRLGVDPPL